MRVFGPWLDPQVDPIESVQKAANSKLLKCCQGVDLARVQLVIVSCFNLFFKPIFFRLVFSFSSKLFFGLFEQLVFRSVKKGILTFHKIKFC